LSPISPPIAICDAADFAAEPIARVLLPIRVPFGFHGAWIPDEGMNQISSWKIVAQSSREPPLLLPFLG
jgi:hypothetical protein